MASGRIKFLVSVGVAALVLGAALFLLTQKPVAPQANFTLLGGEQVSLNSLRGKVVLVNFWATSCPGCIHEMPDLVKTYRKYQARGLDLVAVAMSYDPPDYVRRFSQDNALPFKVALDKDGTAAQAFDARVTPTTFVIDKEGRMIQRIVGEPDFAKLHALLEQTLR